MLFTNLFVFLVGIVPLPVFAFETPCFILPGLVYPVVALFFLAFF